VLAHAKQADHATLPTLKNIPGTLFPLRVIHIFLGLIRRGFQLKFAA
jgi:hypothetical protein